MDFIKYNGFKDIFLALVKKDNKFYIFIMKTDKINLQAERKNETAYGLYFTPICQFVKDVKCDIIIHAKQIENKLFHLIALDNEKEYDKILSTLEIVL